MNNDLILDMKENSKSYIKAFILSLVQLSRDRDNISEFTIELLILAPQLYIWIRILII